MKAFNCLMPAGQILFYIAKKSIQKTLVSIRRLQAPFIPVSKCFFYRRWSGKVCDLITNAIDALLILHSLSLYGNREKEWHQFYMNRFFIFYYQN